MADSQAQPTWLQGLMQGLMGKIGLTAAASQGGPSTAPQTPAPNPWVQSAAPSTAQDPNAATVQQQQTGLQTLKGLFQSLMGGNKGPQQ